DCAALWRGPRLDLCTVGTSVHAGPLDAVSALEVLLPHLGHELSGAPGAARTARDRALGVLPGGAELVVLPGVCRAVRRGGAGVAGGAPFCSCVDRSIGHATEGGTGRAQSTAHAGVVAGGGAPGSRLDGVGGPLAGHPGLAALQRGQQLCADLCVVYPRDAGTGSGPGVPGRAE